MKTASVYISEVKASIKEISVSELAVALSQPDIVLIDVRESEEYQHGHIPASINYPRGLLETKIRNHPLVAHFCEETDAINELAKMSIYLICRTGGRSALAAKSLSDMGHNSVFSVTGGMEEWNRRGLAITTPKP
ncbi:rhodanese-like domain-containing protein [Alteromonas sp. 14N.309.X.WAT.G.H12]|uniref:rhodanese-like domain-containing protein n=1 Tax=Alteromonas sp. 14N.309.X.WAT.G.H12 TaxID=3120824 RepID=UPI002FD06F18